jgi:hypothetical protein
LENFLCEKIKKRFFEKVLKIFCRKKCVKDFSKKNLERNKIQKKIREMKKTAEELTWISRGAGLRRYAGARADSQLAGELAWAHRSPRPAVALGS